MSKPSTKGLKRFMMPTGLYTIRKGQLNRKLLSHFRGVNSGRLTKDQARTLGKADIMAHRDLLMSDTERHFRRQGLDIPEREVEDDIDDFTKNAIEEWNKIVGDM